MSELERRFTSVLVELRAKGDGNKRTIGGYAAKFNTPSQNLGGFNERIDPGFFNKSAGDGWPGVMARYNHDDNMLLGTTQAGTLRLALDNIGLDYEVDPPMSRADVCELCERGDVGHSSFAFQCFEDDWDTSESGFPRRTLLTGRLIDVAPVNSPAYLDTSSGLRSLATKMDASFEEIRSLAASNELTKLFTRTDIAADPVVTRGLSARLALARIPAL